MITIPNRDDANPNRGGGATGLRMVRVPVLVLEPVRVLVQVPALVRRLAQQWHSKYTNIEHIIWLFNRCLIICYAFIGYKTYANLYEGKYNSHAK